MDDRARQNELSRALEAVALASGQPRWSAATALLMAAAKIVTQDLGAERAHAALTGALDEAAAAWRQSVN